MAKQTAVEWLIHQLKHYCINLSDEFIEKAKAMEKEQIIKACIRFGNLNGVDVEDYEEYYNETYGNNE